ncbi:hypothetical protein NL676_012966 [Syzygium grande]|nr:hypothetical protein NL676_012966 [Syzygium grande]
MSVYRVESLPTHHFRPKQGRGSDASLAGREFTRRNRHVLSEDGAGFLPRFFRQKSTHPQLRRRLRPATNARTVIA